MNIYEVRAKYIKRYQHLKMIQYGPEPLKQFARAALRLELPEGVTGPELDLLRRVAAGEVKA